MGWCGQHPFHIRYFLPYKLMSLCLSGHLTTSYSSTVDTFLLFFMFSSPAKTWCQYYPLCTSTIDWLDFGCCFSSEEHSRKLVAKMWQGNKYSSGLSIKNRKKSFVGTFLTCLDWNKFSILATIVLLGCCPKWHILKSQKSPASSLHTVYVNM